MRYGQIPTSHCSPSLSHSLRPRTPTSSFRKKRLAAGTPFRGSDPVAPSGPVPLRARSRSRVQSSANLQGDPASRPQAADIRDGGKRRREIAPFSKIVWIAINQVLTGNGEPSKTVPERMPNCPPQRATATAGGWPANSRGASSSADTDGQHAGRGR